MFKCKSIIKLITDKEYRFRILCARGAYNRLSDIDFLKKKLLRRNSFSISKA